MLIWEPSSVLKCIQYFCRVSSTLMRTELSQLIPLLWEYTHTTTYRYRNCPGIYIIHRFSIVLEYVTQYYQYMLPVYAICFRHTFHAHCVECGMQSGIMRMLVCTQCMDYRALSQLSAKQGIWLCLRLWVCGLYCCTLCGWNPVQYKLKYYNLYGWAICECQISIARPWVELSSTVISISLPNVS